MGHYYRTPKYYKKSENSHKKANSVLRENKATRGTAINVKLVESGVLQPGLVIMKLLHCMRIAYITRHPMDSTE